MKIKDRIEYKTKAPVLKFKSEDLVMVAIKAMSEKNYGACVIVDDEDFPTGIVTERDFMRRLLAKQLDPNITPLKDIMTSALKLASDEDKVVDCLRLMSNERFRHLPIVDSQGKIVNLMSQGDLVSYTWPQLLIQVKDRAVKSVIEQYQLYIIVAAMMFYLSIMLVLILMMKK
jgi:CBS domain-containing protein